MADTREITLTVNGESRTATAETRTSLGDFLRQTLGLTGTHLGCEHGVCGACTVLVDGEAVRSCLMLAVQAVDTEVTTVEGLAEDDGTLSALQAAFWKHHGLQCGFCTPGMIMSGVALAKRNPAPSEHDVREWLEGNLCRCTGYHNIVKAVMAGARAMNV